MVIDRLLRLRMMWLLLLTVLCCASCKKRVAAVPPPQPAAPPASRPAATPAVRAAPPAAEQRPVAAAVRPAAFTPTPRPDVRVDMDQLFKQNMQTVYFDYDQSDIRSDQVPRLETAARWLQQNRAVKFRIQGNCDERGSEEYNLALGDRRAVRVRDFLVREGVDPSRMTTMSYGEERPVCSETTDMCYQRNRRADFQATSTN
jgi:peptidoglycan-associated lipoprotein